ncbi:Arsenic resistance transcriptional regulator ArsR2 [Klebsiella pneumoniae]|nr:Arsenic resistance transcriptional regulator ArsR2 [Klebsiella pneumoniae]
MPLTALKLFKNLSDETRLGIVLLLRELGELCVCDFCTALDESQPKISRHLAMLRESGLLLDRKQGKWGIASRGNGFIIAYPRIFLPGLLR